VIKSKLDNSLDVTSTSLFFNRIKKLKSTKHKNIALRVWNGDIMSRNRLVHMGLAENDLCLHCGEVETQIHVVRDCERAQRIWTNIVHGDNSINLSSLIKEDWHGLCDADFELRMECLWHLLNNKELSSEAIIRRSKKYLEQLRNFQRNGYGDININLIL